MLYVYYGNDTHAVADKAQRLVSGLQQKRPDAQIFNIESGAVEPSHLDELVGARGLFVERHIVVLKRPFETVLGRDVVLERLERFADSQNIFILSDGKLEASHKKALAKYAKQIEECALPANKDRGFNVFALGDALGSRDRKKLWLLYMEARRSGIEIESLLGTLHWAIRSMLLALRSENAESSGQKPFVYSKFKRYAENYGENTLRRLSQSLLTVYHDARRGKHDMDTALESWVLHR